MGSAMTEAELLRGAEVVDPHGERIGVVSGLLLDPVTLHARWIAVRLADGAERLAPRSAATRTGTGRLVVPYSSATIAAAPEVDTDTLTVAQAGHLARHYGWSPSDDAHEPIGGGPADA